MFNKKMYAYTTGTPQTLKQTITYGYTNAGWKDQLKTYNGVAIEYDSIGNVTKDENGYRYTWRKGRELATITKTDGTVVTFRYDQNGQRVRKVVTKDGVNTVTDYSVSGNRIVHMTHPNAAFHFYYDAQGKPNIFKYNGGWYSYLYNLQGDVIAILDSAGKIVVEYNYDAWGATLTKTGSMAGALGVHNPFRYRGYVFDLDTGLYYLRSRYYNPKWGRFINADDVTYLGTDKDSVGCNLFAYCKNDPVDMLDSTGHWGWNVGVVWDIAITTASVILGVAVGWIVGATAGVFAGIAAGVATTGVVNNAVNAAYYNNLPSDAQSALTPSSYNDEYLTRWERLEYTKAQTHEESYNVNAWRYYSEYGFHVYGWYALRGFKDVGGKIGEKIVVLKVQK